MGRIIGVSTTEELVLNPDYKGWRYARIEVYVENEHYPRECGHIRIKDDDLLFEELRNMLET